MPDETIDEQDISEPKRIEEKEKRAHKIKNKIILQDKIKKERKKKKRKKALGWCKSV